MKSNFNKNMKNNLPLSYIEISKGNLIHNIKQFRDLLKRPARRGGGGTKIAVAIKGNAYGHGQKQVSKILEKHVDAFIVNSIEELELLRKSVKTEAFVMGYVQESDLKKAVKLGCVISVFSLKQMLNISAIAESFNIVQKINIPVDAHLGREGFLYPVARERLGVEELPEVFEEIKKNKNLKLYGMYAHFANIEDIRPTKQSFGQALHFSHAKKQIDKYEKAIALAKRAGLSGFNTHISATSGLLVYEKNKGINSLVRLGIGIYGLWPSEEIKKLGGSTAKLKPVLSWKTHVAQVKMLPKGETIGYGLTYKTKSSTKIAVIPQGYADGFPRSLSNKGEVLIGGKRCKILGRVSMNMCVADVTHLKNVKQEDEVVIVGRQGKEEITAEEIAEKSGTINYEATTRLSPLLPRIIVL